MKKAFLTLLICIAVVSCKEKTSPVARPSEASLAPHPNTLETVRITAVQAEALALRTDTISYRNMGSSIVVTGQLSIPPQNEAIITSTVGANIEEISVREGVQVNKGQILAYLSHPNLINLQSDYRAAYRKLGFLKMEFDRQQKLYKEGVAAGKVFQLAQREYESGKDLIGSLKAQLRLLHLNPMQIEQGHLYTKIPIVSPIKGYVQEVSVRTGQYVEPQTTLFEIINPEEIYAELNVYEQDVRLVEKGQEVQLELLSFNNQEVKARVVSVGKAFNTQPKALHVMAKIEHSDLALIPGTYVKARIKSEKKLERSLPESAFVEIEEKYYVFVGQLENEHWIFHPQEVKPGKVEDGWRSVHFFKNPPKNALFAYNNAYYILAEAQKG